jgi:glutathione synthase/RimK-type ligase-like ATP-grasp enzyme
VKIGFVTCDATILDKIFPTTGEPDFISPEPLITPDDYLAVKELRDHDHEVCAILWGTPPESLLDFDLIVIRSPWDYMDSEDMKSSFFNWLKHIEQSNVSVANPPALMHWLLDKHYLTAFEKLGISTIPTEFFPSGSTLNLSTLYKNRGPFVLKQCVSAGGKGLYFIDHEDAAIAHQADIDMALQSAAYMLQPFVPEITTQGEWSFIFLGGRYSHAILKTPAPSSIMVHAERGGTLHFPIAAPAELIAFANKIYQTMFLAFKQATGRICPQHQVLYLRIDVIDTSDGPVLVECEGVEPELFLRARSGSEVDFRCAIEAFGMSG